MRRINKINRVLFISAILTLAVAGLVACANPAPIPTATSRPQSIPSPNAGLPNPTTTAITIAQSKSTSTSNPISSPTANSTPQIAQLPFSNYVSLDVFNEAALTNELGNNLGPPTYPFNDFGIHFSKAFWLQAGQTIDVVLDSTLPVGVLSNSPDQAKVSGGILMELKRDYIDKPVTGSQVVTAESYSRQKTDNGWQTRITLRATANDLPAPFALALKNDSGAPSWCLYSISIGLGR